MTAGEDDPATTTGGEDDPAATAREAFALLGHDLRLDILLSLLDRWRAAHTEPQRYSELMRAVGERDSGKFNYHLDRLRGAYVRKVEGGYVPTASATALYRSVLAHRPTDETREAAFTVDADCPDCGTDLRAGYEGQFLTVTCPACEAVVGGFTYPFPKNGLAGRGDEQVVRAVQQRARHHVSLARTGQCPFCAGTTTVTVDTDLVAADTVAERDGADGAAVEITCDTCTFLLSVDPLFAVSGHPAVTAALYDLGVDLATTATWDLPQTEVEVDGRDPLTLAVELSVGDRRGRVVVDDQLDVVSVAVDGEELEAGTG